jgi:membrane fusion protein (multidrug efflux system)
VARVRISGARRYAMRIWLSREIRTGRRRPGEVEVLEGLSPGETVIVEGTQKARPGQPVTVIERQEA